MLGFLVLIGIGGVTDIGYLLLTGGMGGGLIVSGILAGEVAEEMRNREVWAFVVGIGIPIVAVVSSVLRSTSWLRASSTRPRCGG